MDYLENSSYFKKLSILTVNYAEITENLSLTIAEASAASRI